MVKYYVSMICLLVSSFLHAGTLPASFSGLQEISVEHSQSGLIYFYYNPEYTSILNTINKQTSEASGIEVTDVARITLNEDPKETYLITYNDGFSMDPCFDFYKITGADKKAIGSINGINLYWPGGSYFYSSGHTNSMYDERRKYILKNDRISEVDQPLMYVGLDSSLRKDMTIYASKALRQKIAFLPKGSNITVLLTDDDDFYLVKTPFGLVGWIKIEKYHEDTIIKGLYYRGD